MKQLSSIKKLGVSVIDERGYRKNVGIIIINDRNKVFWGRRVGQKSWQFPQGGVNECETDKEAMFRELYEETGLLPEHVELIGVTRRWLYYELPKKFRRKTASPICVGQKQKWFLLKLIVDDGAIDFSKSDKAEFDSFCWVDYWYPIRKVIFFKKHVYRSALAEFARELGIKPQKKHSYFKKNKLRRNITKRT